MHKRREGRLADSKDVVAGISLNARDELALGAGRQRRNYCSLHCLRFALSVTPRHGLSLRLLYVLSLIFCLQIDFPHFNGQAVTNSYLWWSKGVPWLRKTAAAVEVMNYSMSFLPCILIDCCTTGDTCWHRRRVFHQGPPSLKSELYAQEQNKTFFIYVEICDPESRSGHDGIWGIHLQIQ